MADLICVCCACGELRNCRNICLHDVKGAPSGQGWGCVVCHLPSDGAVSVVCDECFEREAEIKTICVGYPAENERRPLADFAEPFEHDLRFHPEATNDFGVLV